jgi:hypothetical protein
MAHIVRLLRTGDDGAGVTRLTQQIAKRTEHMHVMRMRYTDWLRVQVERLEADLRRHSVFDSDRPATHSELDELREKVVLHRFLRQQLTQREVVKPREFDTQEIVLAFD